jgi:hypothetical protein
LERRWNDALQRVIAVATQLTTLKSQHVTLSDAQRQRLRSVGQDLKRVWHHEAAAAALQTRLLRTVRHAMIVVRTAEPPAYLLPLHWQGGVHPE